MWPTNKFTQRIGIEYPIIQAPMAGFTTAELVAAVSNAGGLGSLGAALLSPAQIQDTIKAIRALTSRPFAVNLFTPFPETEQQVVSSEIQTILNNYRQKLKLPIPDKITPIKIPFKEQLAVILAEKVPVFSFTFGLLPNNAMQQLKGQGSIVIGTATTIREAKLLEAAGVDAIVAQGSEAGGHRGSAADTNTADAMIGSMALITQVVDAVNVPVIASGGIMDGRGVVAAFALGAQAVQMGTSFLTCPETSTHPKHCEALLQSTDESTRITRAFTGRYVRSIKNQFLLDFEKYTELLPPYTIQSALTRDVRQAAAQQDCKELMSLWSGQAASLCQVLPAAELLKNIVTQTNNILSQLHKGASHD